MQAFWTATQNLARPLAMVTAITASMACTLDSDEDVGQQSAYVEVTEASSIGLRQWQHYGPFEVDGTSLAAALTVNDGDPDLYVRVGAEPSTLAYDCRPYETGTTSENCQDLGPGQVYVSVYGYAASSYELVITYDEAGPPPASESIAVTETGTVTANNWRHFGPFEAMNGDFRASLSMNADADLYVRRAAQPTESDYDCRPYVFGNGTETCTLPGAGTYYVSVHGYDSSTDYTLTVSYNAAAATAGPVTTITGGPSGTVASSSASITFASPTATSFECRLDADTWSSCSSPQPYSGLTEGAHAFAVRAVDAAGNTGNPATSSWTVDMTGPTVTITGGPSGTVASNSASFSFASSSVATFQCSFDAGMWLNCSSPVPVSGLADGAHSFAVRARDGAGTIGTPATRTWTVDTTGPSGPTVTLTSGPSGTVTSTTTKFGFTSDTGTSLECQLDGSSWATCVSPRSLVGLASGGHSFGVRARDNEGTLSATASRSWTVQVGGPLASISESDRVLQGQWRYYGPFISSGGEFRAVLQQNADADLYVRRGAQPTRSSYDCRPFLTGSSSESCTLGGAGEFYVAVHGWDPSVDYGLQISFGGAL